MVLQAKRVLAANKVKALSTDGVNDYVEVPDSPSLSFSELTVLMWLYPQGSSAQVYIAKDNGISEREWAIWWAKIDGHIRSFVHTDVSLVISDSDVAPRLNEWQLVGLRYDGSELATIVNGNLLGATPVSGNIVDTTVPLTIGCRGDLAIFTKGLVDSVLIYNRALSDSEIKYLYKHPYNPILSGCVLWLSAESIDESAGVWRDMSGYGNNGTIYGAQAIDMNRLTFSVKKPDRVLGVIR